MTALGTEVFAGIAWNHGRDGNAGSYIARSTDNGSSWVPVMTGRANAFAWLGNDLFAGTSAGMLRTSNHGASWVPINNGLPKSPYDTLNYAWVNTVAVIGSDIFAATRNTGVFRSTDNGTSWIAVNNGIPKDVYDTTRYTHVSTFAAIGTNLFAGTWGSGVFVSPDKGTAWNAVNNGLNDSNITALAAEGTILFAAPWNGGVYQSTDSGKSWKATSNGLPKNPFDSSRCVHVTTFTVSGTSLFAVGDDSFVDGLFLSTNYGTSWELVSSGINLGVTPLSVLAVTDTYAFAGARNGNAAGGLWGVGVWKRPLSEMITSVHPSSSVLPEEFKLEQNYPNPFNPSTKISYQLPTQSHVTLKVFDVLGREVATVVDAIEPAGYKSVQFEAHGLASGVYLYQLRAGAFVSTKKFLLLR